MVGIIFCSFLVLLVWNLTDCGTLRIGDKCIELSSEDTWRFRKALMKRDKSVLSGYRYRCQYSTDYSIHIGGLTYCFAQDECPTIYIEELDFSYYINHEDYKAIYELLEENLSNPPKTANTK